MARSGKVGIEYFSHDVDMTQDPKVKILKAKCKLTGYAVFVRLLEELYKENGYYLQIDEDFNILFCDDCNLSIDVYIEILNVCIEKKLFSEKLYKRYSILTSERIQRTYCDAVQRRKHVKFIKEYLLMKPSEVLPEKIDVCIEPLNVNISPLNANIGTQSKVKESKERVKESKGEYSAEFDKFWNVYPRKSDKKAAFLKFKASCKRAECETIIDAADAYGQKCSEMRTDKKHIKLATTWLNGDCWENDLVEYGTNAPALTPAQTQRQKNEEILDRHMKRIEANEKRQLPENGIDGGQGDAIILNRTERF